MTLNSPRKIRPKLLEVIWYKILYRFYAPKLLLESDRFAGKSVLLAGPARTLEGDLSGFAADDFEVIVKMNTALTVPLPFGAGPDLRCDVLFHCLSDDVPPVTPAQLAAARVSCLVHRTTGKGRFPLTLAAARAFGTNSRWVALLAPERYRALSARLGGASPTTGLVCLDFLLSCDVSRLVIGGFTFFQTKYQPGYDDRDRSDADSMARVKAAGHHDPQKERELAKELIDTARKAGKTIVLAPAVAAALEGQLADTTPAQATAAGLD